MSTRSGRLYTHGGVDATDTMANLGEAAPARKPPAAVAITRPPAAAAVHKAPTPPRSTQISAATLEWIKERKTAMDAAIGMVNGLTMSEDDEKEMQASQAEMAHAVSSGLLSNAFLAMCSTEKHSLKALPLIIGLWASMDYPHDMWAHAYIVANMGTSLAAKSQRLVLFKAELEKNFLVVIHTLEGVGGSPAEKAAVQTELIRNFVESFLVAALLRYDSKTQKLVIRTRTDTDGIAYIMLAFHDKLQALYGVYANAGSAVSTYSLFSRVNKKHSPMQTAFHAHLSDTKLAATDSSIRHMSTTLFNACYIPLLVESLLIYKEKRPSGAPHLPDYEKIVFCVSGSAPVLAINASSPETQQFRRSPLLYIAQTTRTPVGDVGCDVLFPSLAKKALELAEEIHAKVPYTYDDIECSATTFGADIAAHTDEPERNLLTALILTNNDALYEFLRSIKTKARETAKKNYTDALAKASEDEKSSIKDVIPTISTEHLLFRRAIERLHAHQKASHRVWNLFALMMDLPTDYCRHWRPTAIKLANTRLEKRWRDTPSGKIYKAVSRAGFCLELVAQLLMNEYVVSISHTQGAARRTAPPGMNPVMHTISDESRSATFRALRETIGVGRGAVYARGLVNSAIHVVWAKSGAPSKAECVGKVALEIPGIQRMFHACSLGMSYFTLLDKLPMSLRLMTRAVLMTVLNLATTPMWSLTVTSLAVACLYTVVDIFGVGMPFGITAENAQIVVQASWYSVNVFNKLFWKDPFGNICELLFAQLSYKAVGMNIVRATIASILNDFAAMAYTGIAAVATPAVMTGVGIAAVVLALAYFWRRYCKKRAAELEVADRIIREGVTDTLIFETLAKLAEENKGDTPTSHDVVTHILKAVNKRKLIAMDTVAGGDAGLKAALAELHQFTKKE